MFTNFTNYHVTIFVTPSIAEPIETVRRTWDPIMASQIAAHVTLVYPQEGPHRDLLVTRMRTASARANAFRLRLAGIACFGRPEDGVYIAVEDVDGGYHSLREDILRPPFRSVQFSPHVTLVHSRTSSRGRDCWDKRPYPFKEVEFTVREVAITAFDSMVWRVCETFLLRDESQKN